MSDSAKDMGQSFFQLDNGQRALDGSGRCERLKERVGLVFSGFDLTARRADQRSSGET